VSLLDIALLFLRVGAVSFGGGTAVLAELQHELVDRRATITQQQFLTAYSLGQATPGPGILYLVPLGFYVAGPPGALVALVAFLLPPMLLQVVVASQWERLSHSPWIRATDRTLVPISIGLIGSSFHALGLPLLSRPVEVAGVVVGVVIAVAFRANPSLVVLGGGILGLLGIFS